MGRQYCVKIKLEWGSGTDRRSFPSTKDSLLPPFPEVGDILQVGLVNCHSEIQEVYYLLITTSTSYLLSTVEGV